MEWYWVYFQLGCNNSMARMQFGHCTKHDTMEDFERDIQDFCERNRTSYLYKEKVEDA